MIGRASTVLSFGGGRVKMMKGIRLIAGLVFCLGFSAVAGATVINRGNGLLYDTVLNITWLQNPNLGASNTFDLPADAPLGTHPSDSSGISGVILSNGLMNLPGALFWIDAMNQSGAGGYLGFSDWRLPATTQPDLTCSQVDFFTGVGLQGSNFGCVGSEMGHLYYVDGISQSSPGPFLSFPDYHWSGTPYAPEPLNGWGFLFGSGWQGGIAKGDFSAAWAVRDGDVSSIPEPTTLTLMTLGLAGIGFTRKKAA